MLLSLLAIMLFFEIVTDGTLLQPLNLTNLVLQNSYIVIMALGMLLVIVTGHIDLLGRLGRGLRRRGRGGADGALPRRLSARLRRLSRGRRARSARRRATGSPISGFVLHRDAGGHAGVQGPCARGAAGGRSVGPFPPTFQKLSSGFIPELFPGAGTLYPTSLADRHRAGVRWWSRPAPRAGRASSRTASRSSPRRSSSPRASLLAGAVLYFTYLIASHRGLPNVLVIMTVLIALYGFVTRRTVIGRQIYAVGGNAKAAKLSGVKTERLTFFTFVNMGVLARRLPGWCSRRGSTPRRRRPGSASSST